MPRAPARRAAVIDGATRWIEQADDDGLGGYDYSAVVAEIRGRAATG